MPKFVSRERKHKVRRRLEENGGSGGDAPLGPDPNAMEILPSSRTEKETERQAMKDALRAQQPRMSGKKQKRLDKYIVNRKFHILQSHEANKLNRTKN